MRTLARKDAYIILQLKPKCLRHCLTFRKENLDFTTFLNPSQGAKFHFKGGAPRYITLVSGAISMLNGAQGRKGGWGNLTFCVSSRINHPA